MQENSSLFPRPAARGAPRMAHDTTTLEEFGEKSRARGNVTKSINEHRSRLSHSVTSHEQINQRNQHLYPCVAVREVRVCATPDSIHPTYPTSRGRVPSPKGRRRRGVPAPALEGVPCPPHTDKRGGALLKASTALPPPLPPSSPSPPPSPRPRTPAPPQPRTPPRRRLHTAASPPPQASSAPC